MNRPRSPAPPLHTPQELPSFNIRDSREVEAIFTYLLTHCHKIANDNKLMFKGEVVRCEPPHHVRIEFQLESQDNKHFIYQNRRINLFGPFQDDIVYLAIQAVAELNSRNAPQHLCCRLTNPQRGWNHYYPSLNRDAP